MSEVKEPTKSNVSEADANRLLNEAIEKARGEDPSLPPPTKLWDWSVLADQTIVALRYENHPKLGNGPKFPGNVLRTTPVRWVNKTAGLARTANTLYWLVGPERKLGDVVSSTNGVLASAPATETDVPKSGVVIEAPKVKAKPWFRSAPRRGGCGGW